MCIFAQQKGPLHSLLGTWKPSRTTKEGQMRQRDNNSLHKTHTVIFPPPRWVHVITAASIHEELWSDVFVTALNNEVVRRSQNIMNKAEERNEMQSEHGAWCNRQKKIIKKIWPLCAARPLCNTSCPRGRQSERKCVNSSLAPLHGISHPRLAL